MSENMQRLAKADPQEHLKRSSLGGRRAAEKRKEVEKRKRILEEVAKEKKSRDVLKFVQATEGGPDGPDQYAGRNG